MKLLALLLIGAITAHQIALPRINSILFVELLGLVIFWFKVRPWVKDLTRSMERRKHLKEIEKRYISKAESKLWRGRSTVEIQITKEDLFDKL
jgi:hypothetical protein